jgi:hypothetical protein
MNKSISYYQRMIWVGIAINLGFAVPALVAPQFLTSMLGLPLQAFDPWLANAGMLLFGVSLFYAPSGINATRFVIHSWLCVVSRLIAVVFWIYLLKQNYHPDAFKPMLYMDGAMFLILGTLLYLGLSPAERPLALIKSGLAAATAHMAQLLRSPKFVAAASVVLLIVGFLGYQTWKNMFREVPQPAFVSDADHFKYAPIGLGIEARIPYYIFAVMPNICADKMPASGDWSGFGFVFEPGHDLPIGMAKRQIGYPSIEPNCALCHTGSVRQSADAANEIVLGAPANLLNLEAFQWFAYDCASDPKFSVANVMTEIEKKFELGFVEKQFYRFVIVPMAKTGFLTQKAQYSWQKLRPEQGPGRTDTFNPTKMVVFGFPDDSTIGTVDLPQIWNQKPRESMYLHWDGNNNQIRERNYAAAMAVGATPQSVLPANFTRVTDWLLTLQPAKWPFAIDQEKLERGSVLWQSQCASCHSFGQPDTGQVTTNIDEIGTDPYRLDSFTTGLVDKFHEFKKPPFDFGAYRKTQSYANTPTDGIWMRAPYLHNGSVPSLWELLQAPEQRTPMFYRGSNVYDPINVGFISDGSGPDRAHLFKFDTRFLGNHNGGHAYGTDLADEQKWDLIEYMKTL